MPKKRLNGGAYPSRARTDKSLRDERAKSDESLAEFRKSEAAETDASVSAGRDRADAEMVRERASADRRSANARLGPAVSRDAERSADDSRLARERARADETLASERHRHDKAIDRQRARMEDHEEALFYAERALTDRNLASERSRIDRQLERAGRYLARAVTAGETSRTALVEREAFLAILGRHLKRPLLAIAVDGGQLKTRAQAAEFDRRMLAQIDSLVLNAEEALRLLGDLLEHLARWQAESRTANRRTTPKSTANARPKAKPTSSTKAKQGRADTKQKASPTTGKKAAARGKPGTPRN